MKGIEFRAWDIVTKRHYAVCGLDFNDDGKLSEIYLSGIQIDESKPNANVRNPSDVILEQYTGLKDKNGKEIYEGDIVSYIRHFHGIIPQESRTEIVSWRSGEEEQYPNCTTSGFSLPYSEDGYEVIGNVHENQELLETNDVD